MLSLLKRKMNPGKGKVEISDIVERVEVVAFPTVRESDRRIKYHQVSVDGMVLSFPTNTKEDIYQETTTKGDYFTPDHAFKIHELEIGCSAVYTAKGILSLSELTDKRFFLTFGKPTHYDHNRSHWWLLKLKYGEINYDSRFPQEAIENLLVDQKIVSESDTKIATEIITNNIMLHFFGPKNNVNQLEGKRRVRKLINRGCDLAKETYRQELQEILKTGMPGIIDTRRYTYNVLDNELRKLDT